MLFPLAKLDITTLHNTILAEPTGRQRVFIVVITAAVSAPSHTAALFGT